MNISEYIFDFFTAKGVDTAFIVTGGQAMYLNDAIGRSGKYSMIFNHHEQACTMSADAYGRLKNKPAIALVTAGPAAVNAMNGAIGGYIDSAPMIVISGQSALSCVEYQDSTKIRQYGVQGINIKPMVENYVKYFITIDNPLKIKYYLQRAYTEATTGRKGPVWIDVPLDMQRAQVDINNLLDDEDAKTNSASILDKNIDFVYSKLASAKKPLLLVGQGVKLSGAAKKLVEFVEFAKMPVITSRLGIDLINTDSPYYVGRPGNYGERAANFAIQSADLLISVGCRMATALVGHDSKNFAQNAFKIAVDIDMKELEKPSVYIDYKINGDCYEFFDLLLQNKPAKLNDFSAWVKLCNQLKVNYPVVQKEYKTQLPINSYNFVDKLSDIASSASTILVDTGSCFHVASQCWKIKKGQQFLTTGGLSSMGYWCACIGASMANKQSDIICITGDGSFQMNIQELATVKHNNLPIKIFIINNNGYLLIRHTQNNFFGGNLVGESPKTGVWCPDSLKVAEAYGIKGIRISALEEIDSKITEALNTQGPVICEVMTSQNQLLIPRVASEKLADGTLVSRDYDDMFPYLDKQEYKKIKEDSKNI